MYFVYLLKCSDSTLYCGITKDLERRVKEHNGILKGGAKYTKGRRPAMLYYFEEADNLSLALKRESEIKKMKRRNKLSIKIS